MCLSSICSCCLTSAARSMGDCCCPKNSKLGYVMLMFLSVIVAIVLRYYGEDFMSNIYFYTFDVCTSGTCWGYEAVYRISFALCGFFIMMGCVVSCGTGAQCDSGFWCFKICAYVALLVTAWVLPNTFYDGYVEVARVISGVFLVLQIGLLINFAYMWNDDWIEKGWEKGILFISFLLYTGSGALMIVLFLYFGGSDCELNNFLIIFTIIFTVIFTGLSITDWIQHGALLPSGVVTLYCYWLVLSALQGDSSACNQLSVNEDNYWEVAGSLLLAALSVTWAAWNLANKVGSNEEAQPLSPPRAKPSGDDEEKATGDGTTEMSGPPPAPTAEDRQDARDEANELAAEEGEKSARTNMKFHFVLAASSMYMAMVLTDWGSHQNEDDSKTSASMWITIVSQWVTGILYTWTLVAPYLFPDRDFGTAI